MQDIIRVYARFPRALYEELEAHARTNRHSIGMEIAILCEEALKHREKEVQEYAAYRLRNSQETAKP